MNEFFAGLVGESFAPVASVVFWVSMLFIAIAFAIWAYRIIQTGRFRRGWGGEIRLDIVDAAPIDTKRRLVLVRRDDVEHLIVIGGHNDFVVESGIRRTASAANTMAAPSPSPSPASQKVITRKPEADKVRVEPKPAALQSAPPARPTAPDQTARRIEPSAEEVVARPSPSPAPAQTPKVIAAQSPAPVRVDPVETAAPTIRSPEVPPTRQQLDFDQEIDASLDDEMHELLENLRRN